MQSVRLIEWCAWMKGLGCIDLGEQLLVRSLSTEEHSPSPALHWCCCLPPGATLYNDCWYSGTSYVLAAGRYNFGDLMVRTVPHHCLYVCHVCGGAGGGRG